MSDPLNNLIDYILNEPPKPQPETAEVFSFKEESLESSEDDCELLYRTVTARKNFPTCGTCRKKLKNGEKHWYYKDDDGDVYWWCYDCMASVNCLPDEEEIKRAEQNSKV